MMLKMLDCFCGMGGVSDGFAAEGFDVTGIDIELAPSNLGYKHRFIQADIPTLNGEDYQGYDVIWGSPPCRDVSRIGQMYGHNWRNPPNPERGKRTAEAFLEFVKRAQPTFWIMENVAQMADYITLPPEVTTYITLAKNGQGKKHSFWGNFPPFLIPKDCTKQVSYHKKATDGSGRYWMRPKKGGKLSAWENAKIPFAVSRAFARACREALEPQIMQFNMSELPSRKEK